MKTPNVLSYIEEMSKIEKARKKLPKKSPALDKAEEHFTDMCDYLLKQMTIEERRYIGTID